MNEQDKALAAGHLLSEPMLLDAIASLRADALESMVRIPATDADKIREYQAHVIALDGLVARLKSAILAGTPVKRQAVA